VTLEITRNGDRLVVAIDDPDDREALVHALDQDRNHPARKALYEALRALRRAPQPEDAAHTVAAPAGDLDVFAARFAQLHPEQVTSASILARELLDWGRGLRGRARHALADLEKTYRDLAEQSWQDTNMFEALRYRGVADGIKSCAEVVGQLFSPAQPATGSTANAIRATRPASMAVEVLWNGNWRHLPIRQAETGTSRVDRVVAVATLPGHYLAVVEGPPYPAAPSPPALAVGQHHVAFVHVRPLAKVILNSDLQLSGMWEVGRG
jgi:hypothetical protein